MSAPPVGGDVLTRQHRAPPEQFFGALAVGALILVCTAVVMTERPVWMVGEEPPLGMLRPFSEPAPPQPVYSQAQLKKMATMGEYG